MEKSYIMINKNKFTWIKFSDDNTGTGLSDCHKGKKFIGCSYSNSTHIESNDPKDYSYSGPYNL